MYSDFIITGMYLVLMFAAGLFFSKNINCILALVIESSNIVHPCNMIFMLVGKEYCIKLCDLSTKHLLTEIRSGIKDNIDISGLQKKGCSESFISVIFRNTRVAIACDYRYAL